MVVKLVNGVISHLTPVQARMEIQEYVSDDYVIRTYKHPGLIDIVHDDTDEIAASYFVPKEW